MNRSGYAESDDDDVGDADAAEWHRKVVAAMHSTEGQAFLREMAAALDALPGKWLIDGSLVNDDGDCCAIGAVCRARGIATAGMDDDGINCTAERLGVPWPLAAEIAYVNDGYRETPEARWQRMRRWVDRHIAQEDRQMTRSEQQMQAGVVVCVAPGWDVVRLPAADDRMGKAAIEAMNAIIGAMHEERDDAEMLTRIERAVQYYMGERWAIQREGGK